MRWPWLGLTLSLGLASGQALAGPDAGQAEPAGPPAVSGSPAAEAPRDGSQVLTYYGLRKLELDPNTPDDVKLTEWVAFITRAQEQLVYAKGAVERWKHAARLRLLEEVEEIDRGSAAAPEKIARWERVAALYPRTPDAKRAEKRISALRAAELRRLTDAAEEIERAHAGKVERIQAWREVATWAAKSPAARAALRRITLLQDQLFAEAQSVDEIRRVDAQTKLSAWRDVLAGAPSPSQRRNAERRVVELELEIASAQKK